MKCIIIEDQPPAQRILKKYIQDIGTLELVGTFNDALSGRDFLMTHDVDIIFLDIHLPKFSGIDFLKSMSIKPAVILTTAYSEFALESYELDVVDYLLKPFSFPRFVKAVNKVPTPIEKELKEPVANAIFIKSGYEHIKINVEDILYIKADSDYTEIFLTDNKYLSSESLKHWLDYFGEDLMLRVHKSYLVNVNAITKVLSNAVEVGSEISIPIGRAYKENVTAVLLKNEKLK